MRIGDLLDELRHTLKTCKLCAYIDLDVELVLAVSTANKPPQEQLDALAKLVAGLYATAPSPQAAPSSAARAEVTTLLTPDQSYFFFRAPSDPSEVICCECGRHADPGAAEAGANLTLKWIRDAA